MRFRSPRRVAAVVVSLYIALFCLLAVGCSASQQALELVDPDPTRESVVIDFIQEWDAARANGDVDLWVDRMHPGTFEHWSPEECRETLEYKERNPDVSIVDFGAMTYYSEFYFDDGDDRVNDFTDLYRVEIVERSEGIAEDSMFTVAFVDGEPTWFGNCDLPIGL